MAQRVAFFLLLFFPVLAAETRRVEVERKELPLVLVNYVATVTTLDGRSTKAKVLAVNNSEISLADQKRPIIPLGAVKEIRMTEYVGKGRSIGTAVGGSLGLLAGLTAAGAMGISGAGLSERATAALIGIGGLPVGAIAGRLIGRNADRQTVIITIAPSVY